MSTERLFTLLCQESWESAPQQAIRNFDESDFEYLLRFCEVNRADFISRLTREKSLIVVDDLLCRILLLLHYKWKRNRDYRFLNLLAKFRRHYFRCLRRSGSEGMTLAEELNQTLKNDLNAGR